MSNSELQHYGILGMKWGIRRDRGSDGRVTGRGRPTDEAIKDTRRQDSKNRRSLSDDQLLAKISRLEKEKRLRELTDEEIDPGKKASKEILLSAGKRTATTLVAGASLYAVKVALSGKFNLDDAVGYIAPKPKK